MLKSLQRRQNRIPIRGKVLTAKIRYAFNDTADRYFLKPVAKGYDAVTPQFLEDGIHNMFSNVGEVGNVLNSLLQAKFKHGAEDTGRFLTLTQQHRSVWLSFSMSRPRSVWSGTMRISGQTLGY